jgi:ubiquinone/menaquinone biosynthesis C-methylase UbiE
MRYLKKSTCILGFVLPLLFVSEALSVNDNVTFVKTTNDKGWTFTDIFDEFSKEYVSFSTKDPNPTLEIGAGRAATAAVLVKQRQSIKNSAKVVINDLSDEHFKDALAEYPQLKNTAVTFLPGRFPTQLEFSENSFNTILASRIFHFLSPEDWRLGLKKIHTWLKPGGKFYITTGTYFIKHQKDNIIAIEKLKKQGELWPATFPSGKEAYGNVAPSSTATLVDKEILTRELTLAGFKIIKIGYVDLRPYLPDSFVYDGKEAIGAIVMKE